MARIASVRWMDLGESGRDPHREQGQVGTGGREPPDVEAAWDGDKGTGPWGGQADLVGHADRQVGGGIHPYGRGQGGQGLPSGLMLHGDEPERVDPVDLLPA